MKKRKEKIRFENFSFSYGEDGRFGVRDIDLSVEEGEFVVLTGPSGCGKTTLSRCMNGLIPDFFEGKLTGSCKVCGMEIAEHETGDYSPYVGSVFQDPRSQFFTLHVRTELPFPSENLGIPTEVIQERLRGTVESLRLSALTNKGIFRLSSGEKQKVAAASVYATGADVYVLDEPSANLDAKGTEELRQLLRRLKKRGCTVVVSEHKLYYLRDLVDRIVVLQNGRIVRAIEQKELTGISGRWLREHGLRQLNLKGVRTVFAGGPVSDGSPVLAAENLSFRYPKEPVLWRDVSFSCASGEIVGIVGENGTGKSTLIRVLMGLEKPMTGTICLRGKRASPRQRRKESFYVMQDVDYQLFSGSVLGEMLSGREDDPEALTQAKALLWEFHLEEYEAVHPSLLSGGQKQRLSVALACMCGRSFLYLDEPTSGLDAENMRLVRETVQRRAKSGATVFIVTHDYEFAASLFTSLLVAEGDHRITRIEPEQYAPSLLAKIFELEE